MSDIKTVAWLVDFEDTTELWPASEFDPEGPAFGEETHALVNRSDYEAVESDAARYNAFFADGLSVCFRGVEYHDKAALDAAIDAAMAAPDAADRSAG